MRREGAATKHIHFFPTLLVNQPTFGLPPYLRGWGRSGEKKRREKEDVMVAKVL
jgi:hypothetical protein